MIGVLEDGAGNGDASYILEDLGCVGITLAAVRCPDTDGRRRELNIHLRFRTYFELQLKDASHSRMYSTGASKSRRTKIMFLNMWRRVGS